MAKRAVLAYSGGVDTTACIPYLRHELGVEFIVAMAADLGQGDELEPIREKALQAGADVSLVVDAKERFVREFGLPAVQANALYDGHYPLTSALGRPLIGELLVETAHAYDCDAVAHGCTGKGNDQVRLDLTVGLLDSSLEIVAPARIWDFSRAETIAYSEKYGIVPHVSKEKPWAIDLNVLGRNVEAGLIEDLGWEPTEEVWDLTTAPQDAPESPAYVTIGFERGLPATLDGKPLAPLDLLRQLNARGGQHGVGRIDMLENRVVGVKSRELYEAPAMTLLIRAHQELENLTLPADVLNQKRPLEAVYGKAVYDGLWHGLLRKALEAFVHETQRYVTGEITLKLYKGGVSVVARSAERSLYRHELVTYGNDCTFDQSSAEGFIDIFGLPSRVWNTVNG
ncbi:argininosuccinate synthase [Streptomyces sp. B-S-A8]|uniref:Argininosuccinate synthase n=1 Tax=Streptomyces solicavernae TaxID=3043614 RepID=A0ABT6RY52_9ACTN|nr:argininosuccinate synthase [Streptomyces sp. B-S-A8]MDI3389350.1 argininosuccinate synthase [Streptomyces sp. B-S-A8]